MAAAGLSISIGPDHVQKIEVLRGSVVDLGTWITAVVNIVTVGRTRQGQARVENRQFGQRNVECGRKGIRDDHDLRIGRTRHTGRGESIAIRKNDDYAVSVAEAEPVPHAGEAIIGGVREPSSDDMGVGGARRPH